MIYLVEQYTPWEVQKIFKSMIEEFDDYSEELEFDSNSIQSSINWLSKNNRKTLGRCKCEPDGYFYNYQIFLNPNMLNFEEDGERTIKNTIAHELCHTLPDCMNHGKEFHRKAKMIQDLMGYVIDTKADVDSSAYFRKYLPNANYKLVCDNCGTEIPKSHICDEVTNPGRYRCGKCKGTVSSYKLNKATGEYELYKTANDELEYKYKYVCPDCGWVGNKKTRNQTFVKNIETLKAGNRLICPKCEKNNVYIVDNGQEIHSRKGNMDDFLKALGATDTSVTPL